MTFKPVASWQAWAGLAGCLGILAFDALLLLITLTIPVSGLTFILTVIVLLSLPLLVYLAYRTYGTFTLEYWVDRDTVTVTWGPSYQIIPLTDIQQVVRGEATAQPVRRTNWPAPWVGRWQSPHFGDVFSYATRPVGEQLLLVTSDTTFGISPQQPDAFVAALRERYRLGPARRRQRVARHPSWRVHPLWSDTLGLGLVGTGFLLNLLLFGILTWRFPGLATSVPLHFDALGQPDRIGAREALFVLPLLALFSWLVNCVWGLWLYRRQSLAAYLLWVGALIVQVLALFALQGLINV